MRPAGPSATLLGVGCVALFLFRVPGVAWGVEKHRPPTDPAVAAPAFSPAPALPDLSPSPARVRGWLERAKTPTPWFTWGGDIRLRETYSDNAKDLLDELDDTQHFFRMRTRLWARFGPFLADDTLGVDNGLSFYARITHEFRTWFQRQDTTKAGNVDEVLLDNLYLDWRRIGGLPLSVRAGRQDLDYGRGLVIKDGTPLDGTRTHYSDAIKATLHLDEGGSTLDFLLVDNKARHDRIEPLNDQRRQVSEFDTALLGAYLIANCIEDGEVHAYYLYKEDDPAGNTTLPGRTVHTLGGLAQGILRENWDYYAELACQWGREGSVRRRGWGLSTDFGYTFRDSAWRPRLHAGYEYLSGDDPGSSTYEAWDPVLARWRRWSVLYDYWWKTETGLDSCFTNLQRFTVGAEARPTEKMGVGLDYSYILANEHTFGEAFASPKAPYGSGLTRGQLVASQLTYAFSDNVAGELIGEYFHPGSYYADSTDDAIFLRAQLRVKF